MTPKLTTLQEPPVENAFRFCGGPLGGLDAISYEDGDYLQPTILKRMIKSIGIPRVSKQALDLFSGYLNAFIEELIRRAAIMAEHARRKTIQTKDIKEALRQLDFKVYM
jgi:histone H3/H4